MELSEETEAKKKRKKPNPTQTQNPPKTNSLEMFMKIEIWNHRIIERFGLEETFKYHLVHPPVPQAGTSFTIKQMFSNEVTAKLQVARNLEKETTVAAELDKGGGGTCLVVSFFCFNIGRV